MPSFYERHAKGPEFSSWQLNSENDIRLLQCRLRPHHLTGLKWEIAVVSVDINIAPPYEAVSYVWGDSKVVHELEVQVFDSGGILDFTISITASLYSALPYLLATSTTGYLWIDQLCIAQDDPSERNHQVYMMPDIYRGASRCLIWLGTELGESRMLCPLVETLEKALCEESSTLELAKADNWNRYCLEARSMICEILGRPWFTRAWILQEAILSSVATVIVGSFHCNIDHLWAVIHEAVWSRPASRLPLLQAKGFEVLKFIMANRRLADIRKPKGRSRMLDSDAPFYFKLSVASPHLQASKSHDFIYAFLGLQDNPDIRIYPNYEQPLAEIMVNTARDIIEGSGDLDIFSVLRRGTSESLYVDKKSFPSWVPVWTLPWADHPISGSTNRKLFSASQKRQHVNGYDGDDDTLVTRGKQIDTVAHAVRPFTWKKERSVRDNFQLQKALKEIDTFDTGVESVSELRLFTTAIANGALLHSSELLQIDERDVRHDIKLVDKLYRAYLSEQTQPDGRQTDHDITKLRRCAKMTWKRRIIVGANENIGLAPHTAKKGDIVVILHGSSVPVVLRKRYNNTCEVIGQCYFEDSMFGEAMTWEEDSADTFVLQ